MTVKTAKFLIITCGLIAVTACQKAVAINLKAGTAGEVSTDVKIHDNDGIFSGTASFTFSVKNATDNDQTGTVSYLLTTERGQKIGSKRINVKIGKNSSDSYDFNIPGLAAGFYATLVRNARKLGYGDCEMSWILEDNVLMNRSLEAMGAKRYKTYRIYDWN